MITAFGAAAERFALGLGEVAAVITEPDHIIDAYFEALSRRERGERFYGMILADDARVALANSAAMSILNQFADIDMRARAFRMLAAGTVQVAGRPASEVWSEAPLQMVSAEFYRLASAMLVRSYAEFTKYAERAGGYTRPVERVLVETHLPQFERRIPDRPSVVIWAPHRLGSQLGLPIFGLSEWVGNVCCVAADTNSAPAGVRCVTRDDPDMLGVLGRAGCIVCIEPNDPGDAVAFARQGFGIVAPLTSGAHEFAPDVVVWDAADAMALHRAAARALSRPAAIRQAYVAPPAVPAAPASPMPRTELPLVTVVIPTYNRPKDLRTVLQAVAAQTYPSIEALVVNDRGSAVDDVVAEFPFARLIEHDVNTGTIGALETGWRNAKGEYIEFLPDDDSIYPDHIERVMFAMLRTGAKIAHGNGMLRYVERAPDGTWKTTGVNASLCSETLTPTIALIATPVSENAVIQHRSVYDEAGWWLNDNPLSDHEIHMRLGLQYVFVHVDEVTFEFREHAGNQAKKFDFAAELQNIYEHLHPVPDRPLLAEDRKATHAAMAKRIPGQPAFPPTIRLS